MAILATYDTETTGTDPEVDEICQFACVVHSDRDSLDQTLGFETLCDPGRPIPPEAEAVHKISNEMVRGQRPAAEVVQEWFQELAELSIQRQEPLILGGHNTAFDCRFIRKHVNIPEQVGSICTMRLARRFNPAADNHTLEYLYRDFYKLHSDRTVTAHDALCDVWMSFEMLRNWMHYLPMGGYQEISQKLTQPVTLSVMPFSKKHKGRLFSQIPRHFLQWLVDQGEEMDMDVRYTAEVWLRGAGG